MGRNMIYTVNSSSVAVAPNQNVPLGSIVRRKSCAFSMSGSQITVLKPGFYDIDVNATFTASEAGTVTISVYQDGNLVPGATASQSVATATTEVNSMDIPAAIRVNCGQPSIITLVVSGTPTVTFSNVAVRVSD